MWKLHTSLYDEATGTTSGGDTNTANIPSSFNPFGGTPSPTEQGGPQTDTAIPAAPVNRPAPTQITPQNPTGNRQQQPNNPARTAVAPVAQPVVPPIAAPLAVIPPPAVALTPEQLQTLAASMRAPAAPVVPQQPAAMTEAEFKKQFNVYEATADDYQSILGVAPQNAGQVEAFNRALQSVARQAVTINRTLMDDRIAKLEAQLESRLGPVTQSHEQQREATIERNFLTQYPGLSDYKPLLREIATAAQARGMKFNNEQEMQQFAAAQAGKLLGRDPATFRVATMPQGGQQTTQTRTVQPSGARTMSTTSMGGRSGQTGGAAPVQSTAERIFAGA